MIDIGLASEIQSDVLRIGGGPSASPTADLEWMLLPVGAALSFLALSVVVRGFWGLRAAPAAVDSLLLGGIFGAAVHAVRVGTFVSWVPVVALVSAGLLAAALHMQSARTTKRVQDELDSRKARLAQEDARPLESLLTELQSAQDELARERALAPEITERVRAWRELRAVQDELRQLRQARLGSQRDASRGATRNVREA